jgi:hypothetical protein
MAKSGMNPKVLQYLMGHSDISVTLNTYTHLKLDDAYCRMNPLYATVRQNPDGTFVGKAHGVFPIIPSFSYTLKF